MTQYSPYNVPPQQPPPPPQYPGQGYGYYPPPDPLGPARRASILMFILGSLLLVCGACATGFSFVSTDRLPPEAAAQFQEADQQLREQTGKGMMASLFAAGVRMLIPGILFLILGFFVRGGGRGSIVGAMVLTGLGLAWMLIELIGSIPQIARQPAAAPGLCFVIVPLALLGVLMYFLVAALRAAPHVAAMRDQHASQYWQHQQNQQHYGQAGYGYQQPGITPGPPPPPPPPPSGQERGG